MNKYFAMIVVAFFINPATAAEVQVSKVDKAGFTFAVEEESGMASQSVLVFKNFGALSDRPGENFKVGKDHVDENIEAINKYLKWAAIAKERGDAFHNKEIATVETFGPWGIAHWNKYAISSTDGKYFLRVTLGKIIHGKTLFESSQFKPDGLGFASALDENQAIGVIHKLLEFKEGKISREIENAYQ